MDWLDESIDREHASLQAFDIPAVTARRPALCWFPLGAATLAPQLAHVAPGGAQRDGVATATTGAPTDQTSPRVRRPEVDNRSASRRAANRKVPSSGVARAKMNRRYK
jgi:hypothetical protein